LFKQHPIDEKQNSVFKRTWCLIIHKTWTK
jgi:hypothetical protein